MDNVFLNIVGWTCLIGTAIFLIFGYRFHIKKVNLRRRLDERIMCFGQDVFFVSSLEIVLWIILTGKLGN